MADLIVTAVNPTTAPEAVIWSSDPQNVIGTLPLSAYLELFLHPVQLQRTWDSYDETICSVDPSGRGSDETAAAYIPTKRFSVLARNACLQRRILRQHASGHSERL